MKTGALGEIDGTCPTTGLAGATITGGGVTNTGTNTGVTITCVAGGVTNTGCAGATKPGLNGIGLLVGRMIVAAMLCPNGLIGGGTGAAGDC